MGGEEFEEGEGEVFAFEGGEKGLGFVAKAGLFGGVMNLPGEVEIGPVDVRRQLRDRIGQFHELTERDGLGEVGGINLTIGVDGVAVAEGAIDAPEVHVTIHGTPATTALNQGFGDGPTSVGTDNHDVGLITLAEETTIADFEKSSRVVTHQFDKTFEREDTLIDEFEHRNKGELDHGHATGCTSAATLFLGEEMGGVVSTNRRDAAIAKGLTQGIAIALGLNGGIALNASTKSIIVPIAEIEMAYCCFACKKRVRCFLRPFGSKRQSRARQLRERPFDRLRDRR